MTSDLSEGSRQLFVHKTVEFVLVLNPTNWRDPLLGDLRSPSRQLDVVGGIIGVAMTIALPRNRHEWLNYGHRSWLLEIQPESSATSLTFD